MYANHGEETSVETILCSQNRLSGLHQALIHKTKLVETNLKCAVLYGFSYGMASASVRRSRLATAALVVGNIVKTIT